LCIGSQRCATSYLNQVLEAHPHVQMAPKEPNFFNHTVRTHGLDWYLQHFEAPNGKSIQARGEISPNYAVMRRREIQLAKDLFPHLKIILLVRHPVDRMWSALRRHWTFSYLDDVSEIGKNVSSILGYADQRLPDAFGDYRAIYENWTSVFDEERILLLRYDQMKAEPDRTVSRVLEFLGVESDIEWIQSYREGSSPRNQSTADVEMSNYVQYYLSRRYIDRIKAFNTITNGFVQDWVDDMDQCLAAGNHWWELRYRVRSAVRYHPVQWVHRFVDPFRTWWKVRCARWKLSSIFTDAN